MNTIEFLKSVGFDILNIDKSFYECGEAIITVTYRVKIRTNMVFNAKFVHELKKHDIIRIDFLENNDTIVDLTEEYSLPF